MVKGLQLKTLQSRMMVGALVGVGASVFLNVGLFFHLMNRGDHLAEHLTAYDFRQPQAVKMKADGISEYRSAMAWTFALLCLIQALIALVTCLIAMRWTLAPLGELANKARALYEGDLSVTFETLPGQNELATLNNTIGRLVTRLLSVNTELEAKVAGRTAELQALNAQLNETEASLVTKNMELARQQEALTAYLNRLSEQQERERLVKWIVHSIRESLHLSDVLTRTCDEIGYLLKVDRCYITLYEPEEDHFRLTDSQYKSTPEVTNLTDATSLVNRSAEIHRLIRDELRVVSIEHVGVCAAIEPEVRIACEALGIRSTLIVPIVHQRRLLGAIHLYQANEARKWTDTEINLVRDISHQVGIAIQQASLYSQAQEATRMKTAFLANMSHELRTPLNAIIGFSEMILSRRYGGLTDKQSEYLNHIVNSGHHLLALVNDILDLSKVETGNMELQCEFFVMPQLIAEVVDTLKAMADKKNIRLNTETDNRLTYAYTDPLRLKQILYNLLSNAIKFTPEGGHVRLLAQMATEPELLTLQVIDSGIGISDADCERIFSEFQQLDASYARRQEGTGLGLALTRRLVHKLGGTIDFVSQLGIGTTFTVELPCLVNHFGLQREDRDLPSETFSQLPVLFPPAPSEQEQPCVWVLSHLKDAWQPLDTLLEGQDWHLLQSRLESLALPRPQLILIDLESLRLGHLETDWVAGLRHQEELSDIPSLFFQLSADSKIAYSLGVIDMLLPDRATTLLPRHLEQIQRNIVKADSIQVLALGSRCLLDTLYQSRLFGNQSGKELVWMDRVGHDTTASQWTRHQRPDAVLLEFARLNDPVALDIVRQFKSRIETRFIPIIGLLAQPGYSLGRNPEEPFVEWPNAHLAKDLSFARRLLTSSDFQPTTEVTVVE